jgi:ribonuclease HII
LDAEAATLKPAKAINQFEFEQALGQLGVRWVAGVDEAGRGPLAGPVLAAAVMLPLEWRETGLPADFAGLNDSKQLTPIKRDIFFQALTSRPEIHFALGQSSVETIDALNILQATHQAMRQALQQLQPPPEYVLVDGLRVPMLGFPQIPLVKGDTRSYSIAAASVIAKVSRDRLMKQFHRLYPAYGFAENKGYGTRRHLAALAKHGPSPIHRRSFAPLRLMQLELFNVAETPCPRADLRPG